MTPEVKERIEQIRHGNVPEGYKKGKIGIVPVEWENLLRLREGFSYRIIYLLAGKLHKKKE